MHKRVVFNFGKFKSRKCSISFSRDYVRKGQKNKKALKNQGFSRLYLFYSPYLVEATGLEPTKKRINPFKIKTCLKYFAKLPQIFKPHFVLFCIFKEPRGGALFLFTLHIRYIDTSSYLFKAYRIAQPLPHLVNLHDYIFFLLKPRLKIQIQEFC